MQTFIAKDWSAILRYNQLDSFEALWQLEAEWFEPPNHRRGGWSGASQYNLKLPEGGEIGVFIKRQENHMGRTLQHPILGEPSFAIEMRNILCLQEIEVPSLTPVYYEQRKVSGNIQAILITEELVGYQPLNELIEEWTASGWPWQGRRALIEQIADALSCLHQHRYQHHGLYTKHIFVQWNGGVNPKVALIDLEKMRANWNAKLAMRRDLYTLLKDFGFKRLTDQMRFLQRYCDQATGLPKVKQVWRELHKKAKHKQAHLFES